MIKIWFERSRVRLAVLLHDLLTIPVAWLLAYWTRFNLAYVPPEFIADAIHSLPLVVVVVGSVYGWFGLHRGVWRFTSVTDLVRIAKSVLVATTVLLFLLFVLNRMAFIPRSLPVLFVIFQFSLLAGSRLLYRWIKDQRLDWNPCQRVLIVGAGRAGEMLVRDMLRNRRYGYVAVAFVDDKPHRQGNDVHGVPVRGTSQHIPDLVEALGIDLILLATPSASAGEMQRLVRWCEKSGCPFHTVPQLSALISGQAAVNQLRPVSIEDLLGRNPVTLDWADIRGGLADRVVLITGAGGSIGSELCRQIQRCKAHRLVLVDNCEYNLYSIEMELLDSGTPLSFTRHLMDITDPIAVTALFRKERPEVVFHAAAYKHVPLLEDQVCAAVRNNVIGTKTVAAAAATWGCERFVLISTDKAVNPCNVMGITKRIAELLCQMFNQRSACCFVTVRFGNVLDSAGSVIPRFRHQIECGGPVTVTHPKIERFFMTIPEACQLIMQAAVMGEGGELFVLDMGEPVNIGYLAEQMIRLSGQQLGQDISIEYTGLRPGEKLFEELFYSSEELSNTPHPKIHISRAAATSNPGLLDTVLEELQAALADFDEQAVLAVLTSIFPDWQASAISSARARPNGAN